MSYLDTLKSYFAAKKSAGEPVGEKEEAEVMALAMKMDADTPASVPAAAPAMPAEPSADVVALTAQVHALTALVTAQSASIVNDKTEARLTANRARIRSMVEQMKLTPAAAEQWKVLAATSPDAFEASFAITEKTAKPDRSVIRERLVSTGAGAEADTSDPGAALTARAKQRAKADKISFTDALRLVSSENPDLARAHAADIQTVAGNPND